MGRHRATEGLYKIIRCATFQPVVAPRPFGASRGCVRMVKSCHSREACPREVGGAGIQSPLIILDSRSRFVCLERVT